MKIEAPDFLIEMSKQMQSQNNRLTADPLFEVRYKKYLVTEQGYNEDHWCVIAPDSEGYADYASRDVPRSNSCEDVFARKLWASENDWCKDFCWFDHGLDIQSDFTENEIKSFFLEHFTVSSDMELPDEWRILFMQEIEETFTSCLTEADAKAAIKRKQHDYPKMYIYATSLYWAPQMKDLRNWILSLTKDEV